MEENLFVPANIMRHAILITGMGRSGTSALARVLALCGAGLPDRLLPANHGNPTGYWEPRRAIDLNNAFLSNYGSSWYDPTFRLQTAQVVSEADRSTFVDSIREFIVQGFEGNAIIVVKEPRISGLLEYWIAAVRAADYKPKVVHIFRHPNEVVRSLRDRDALPTEHSLLLWLKYNLLSERGSRSVPRAFVTFDSLLRDWRGTIADVIERTGTPLSVSTRTEQEVALFLSSNRKHHTELAPPSPRPLPWVRRVYHSLLAAAGNGALDKSVLDDCFEEIVGAERLFGIAAESYGNGILPATLGGDVPQRQSVI